MAPAAAAASRPVPREEKSALAGSLSRGRFVIGVELLPPLRPKTTVAFSAQTYADQLTLVGHFDDRLLAEPHRRMLLDAFAARVCASAGVASEPSVAR